jgi:hypothetical protein
MILSNKYNVPQQTIDKMVKDGVISCSWPRYEQIYQAYKSARVAGSIKTRIIMEVAEKEKVSERTVRDIIAKFE